MIKIKNIFAARCTLRAARFRRQAAGFTLKRAAYNLQLAAVYSILFAVFYLQGCYAQNQGKIGSQADITDPYVWNFGQVQAGEILKHNFILKNESKKILTIKDVNTSCGCTVSKVKKNILLPGENTLIEVRFDSRGYSGPAQQFIYVHTDSLDASASLSINGEGNRTIDNTIIRYIIKAEVK